MMMFQEKQTLRGQAQLEPHQRAHFPRLAFGLASENKRIISLRGKIPCSLLQGTLPFFACLIVLVIAFFPFSRAVAGETLSINADQQFRFAEHYFNTGEYRRAADEYQRFIYFFPGDERVEAAMFNSSMAHFRLRLFAAAINGFQALTEKYIDTDLAVRAYLMISECYVKAGAYDAAVINLRNLLNITDKASVRDEVYYRLGWVYIEMAAWEDARQAFAGISAKNSETYQLKRLSAELANERQTIKKNPTLAGFLSIIPGAGQLYLGRNKDALIAFLVNAGLILAAYEAFDHELYALGAVITFVEVGFYGGNIYSAVNSAHKHNRKADRDFIENLKRNTKLKLSTGHQGQKWILSVNYTF